VPKNGGVVMVPFVTAFVSQAVKDDDDSLAAHPKDWRASHPRPTASIAQVADVIDHVRKIAGVDHVGIGSGFDGISETVVGLEDVSKFPFLFAELSRRGWSETDLKKLSNGNVLRVLKQNEQVAARLQKTRKPSNATIEQLDRGVKPKA
jgi:membrane dipeptidase